MRILFRVSGSIEDLKINLHLQQLSRQYEMYFEDNETLRSLYRGHFGDIRNRNDYDAIIEIPGRTVIRDIRSLLETARGATGIIRACDDCRIVPRNVSSLPTMMPFCSKEPSALIQHPANDVVLMQNAYVPVRSVPRKDLPQTMCFYWGNEQMSWMRYMSIKSFRLLNPKWQVLLYVDPTECNQKPWRNENVQDFHTFQGRDYYKELHSLDVEIIDWRAPPETLEANPQLIQACASHKSNLFKWNVLAEAGGWYSDLDILYVRPMEMLAEDVSRERSDVVLCEFDGYVSIGFLGSKGNNRFFRNVYNTAVENFDPNEYQCLGVKSLYKAVYGKPSPRTNVGTLDSAARQYPDVRFYNMPQHVIYPWTFKRISQIFEKHFTLEQLAPTCIGVHWFAGSEMAQHCNNVIHADNYREYCNTFTVLVERVFNE